MKVTRIVDPTDECGLCRAHTVDYSIVTGQGSHLVCHSCVVRYARYEIRVAVADLVEREMEKGEFEDGRPRSSQAE